MTGPGLGVTPATGCRGQGLEEKRVSGKGEDATTRGGVAEAAKTKEATVMGAEEGTGTIGENAGRANISL